MPVAKSSRFSGLGSTAALLSLLVWMLISLLMINRNLLFASGDDFSRIVIAMGWAKKPFFFTWEYYWLPLPFWYYGLWYKLLSHVGGLIHWFIPPATLMMALSCWGIMLVAFHVNRSGGGRFDRLRRVGAVFAALALALTIPFTWRMTATGLAEPVFMALMSWLGLLMVLFHRRPTALNWLGIFLLCEALMWTRYEGWPFAFLTWMVACHIRYRRGVRRPRFQWQLLAGWLAFAALPMWLMWVHSWYSHDPLRIFKIAYVAAKVTPQISEATTGFRLEFLTGLAIGQGWVVLPLFVVGLIHGRRLREIRVLALLSLFLWLSYFQMAITNTVGWNPPSRFCVPALWMMLPVAARGLIVVFRVRRLPGEAHWAGWVFRAALAIAIFIQINHWNERNWGGVVAAPELLQLADRLSIDARESNGYLVVRDPDALGDYINLFRIYMGVNRVLVEREWFPQKLPIRGRFFYLRKWSIDGVKPDIRIAGMCLYIFDQWPPRDVVWRNGPYWTPAFPRR
ncbi:hypothetical protein LLG95_01640 [bacterium]|nr:hypothetical protein [bacterium]